MIGSISLLFVLIGSAFGYFHGVDPNALKCDPTGMVSLLLPHFTDCSKFYMCAHGSEVEFRCPPDTIFDFPIQTCNWPWATKCWLRKGTDDNIEGSGEDEFVPPPKEVEIVIKPASTETMMSGRLDCHNLDTASRRVGFKGDCQRYWSCTAGSPHAYYCSDGLFFNEEKQECDFEANSKCIDENIDELHTEFIEYK
ncbi:peritrophin-1-like [Pieris brassicae]|uniref:Chitin-binding type-2 domain-containing protein n=1 Tax=Pieris brassicae TaxID=7116 RepID=A0A9P0XJ06_PIEBR|nr:peritrophin-1-like [Pieris brassicae]CAH4036801.1 unnamed protein product [Pieris brassicae]